MSAANNPRARTELLLLVACCGFLLFYGLGAFGLLGADEPRYVQVAREMLDRVPTDWVTPTLNGKPWLEKPPLYYWQAMIAYRGARAFSPAKTDSGATGASPRVGGPAAQSDGVSEQTARFPGALDAALMIAAIYFFLRRVRPRSEVDGALITASCAGIIGFAHAASTDMPLTATFTIALLAWFAWFEGQDHGKPRRVLLAAFYIFLALGTLAKGPVAPALAAVVIMIFAAIRRDWHTLARTLWLPGIVLFFLVALPWYIAVQLRNPEFFRVFILEHNLARFSSNVYHHPQPFWFYLPVFLLASMPWTLWLIAAITERVRQMLREGREAFASSDDTWALFLFIWMLVPLVFFSASQSKLPGYILPAVPASALLVTEYLSARRSQQTTIALPLAAAHGILCGLMVFAALAAAKLLLAKPRHLTLDKGTLVAATMAAVFALAIAAALVTRAGPRLLRSTTMFAVVVSMAAIVRLAAPAIDATQSSRPVAVAIQALSREVFPQEPPAVALYHVSRVHEYGLDFYLHRPTQVYESGEVPADAHILVAAPKSEPDFSALLHGRKVSYLISIPAQKLELYWVGK
jgi:4-amino-4-deoxy-L-arabinose transferase-like glycosyltransferase